MRLLLAWVVCGLAVTANADRAADEAAVKQTLISMWAALEAGDIEAYAQHVHAQYSVFGESDVYLAEGKALELRNMTDWLGRAKNVHTEMHNAQVTVRGDTAWITYYWTDAGLAGGERFTSRGKSTRIFVREGGRWLCIHGHFTAVP